MATPSSSSAISSATPPLLPTLQRALGDRSYDKRKNAALEIEAIVKQLYEQSTEKMEKDENNDGDNKPKLDPTISSIIQILATDFCTSTNANHRKGGLIGIAATSIGLMQNSTPYLESLLPPVLHSFDDPESRVRYYACESLYNIAKVARSGLLHWFNPVFEGLCKLFADVDLDVKNGANLLDRLVKDIVTETETFNVETFIPLLQKYIRRTNPYIRQLLVGWITVLDGVPDICMVDWLPDFLEGLFNMLSDGNREIRQAADSCLGEFLREIKNSEVVEYGPMVSILVSQCNSKERLNRLTAINWVSDFISLGGDVALRPYYSEICGAISACISDAENEIRVVAEKTNSALLSLVKNSEKSFELPPLLNTLLVELRSNYVQTKLSALRWINMLLEKLPNEMNKSVDSLLPVLLETLSDDSDSVVLLVLQVLSRISLHEKEFKRVINAVLHLFSDDRRLLERRGSLVVRKLCVLMNSQSVYLSIASVLTNEEAGFSLEYISTMIQTLNLILLTAHELDSLRLVLKASFKPNALPQDRQLFESLFRCWCHNPVSTYSLCLLAQAYQLSFALIRRFSSVEISVGFLMQLDKLVQLMESPIFISLRLQLLEVDQPFHPNLLKSLYGVLMLLPQSTAFRTLNDRLATVCNLRDNLTVTQQQKIAKEKKALPQLEEFEPLLQHFDEVMQMHSDIREKKITKGYLR